MSAQQPLRTLKIVYYGPGLAGKTTNLIRLHDLTAESERGEVVSLPSRSDRTLLFDLFPLRFGGGERPVAFKLYTVPGQVQHDATRKAVLSRADGIVFVADSSPAQTANNFESLASLERNAAQVGIDLEVTPLVLQYNKRDLPDAVPEEEARRRWEGSGVPLLFASALHGAGVRETFETVARLVLARSAAGGVPA
jgi:signal recognition particle receptor subunit beta